MNPIRLGVNVDHVATVRQARRGAEPDPVAAALEAERAGADSIVCHLREDRRHIQDKDAFELKKRLKVPLNLEMGLAPSIVEIAKELQPRQVTLVPEKRQELTTEGGLDVLTHLARIRKAVGEFEERGIEVSLFIDPDLRQISAARRTGAMLIEIHTGGYANAANPKWELRKIIAAAREARRVGFQVAAGHGLNYVNTRPIAAVPEIEELNIGHSLVSRSIFAGMARAVREMKKLMSKPRRR